MEAYLTGASKIAGILRQISRFSCKPNFKELWSDFTDNRDFRNFRSDFRTYVKRILEEVGPSEGALKQKL